MTTFYFIIIILILVNIAWVSSNMLREIKNCAYRRNSLLNDIERRLGEIEHEVDHIDTILHNGFEQTGRSNGGSNIDPKWKH